jgi:CHASE1-domain containing sensor protein
MARVAFGKERLVIAALAILSFAIVGGIIYFLFLESMQKERERENLALHRTASIVSNTLQSYTYVLKGIGGLYAAADFMPTDAQLKRNAAARNDFSSFPGAFGFGFVRFVLKENLESYEAKRRLDLPDFRVKFIDRSLSEQAGDFYVI